MAAESLTHQAIDVLRALGIPMDDLSRRRQIRMAHAFLAVAGLRPGDSWQSAKSLKDGHLLRSRDVIAFVNEHFGEKISMGSYDDIRRQDLKLPVLAGLVTKSAKNPTAATNDPTRAYALSDSCVEVVRSYGSGYWKDKCEEYSRGAKTLADELSEIRDLQRIPISIDGKALHLTPGKHNELQKSILEQFLPRYGYGAKVLYVGDTANKQLYKDQDLLEELGLFALEHDELPDVVAYSRSKDWLYLIEAVHSANPITPVRHLELRKQASKCKVGIVFVTAFLDRESFKKFVSQISWETEVWIAESPDHIIHFNGERFLGPYLKSV